MQIHIKHNTFRWKGGTGVCTWDALNTKKSTVDAVISEDRDYVGALKGNGGYFTKK